MGGDLLWRRTGTQIKEDVFSEWRLSLWRVVAGFEHDLGTSWGGWDGGGLG